jgi:hypothetical protein
MSNPPGPDHNTSGAQASEPVEEASAEDAPAETAPGETARAQTEPAETARAQTEPAETAPAQAEPAETERPESGEPTAQFESAEPTEVMSTPQPLPQATAEQPVQRRFTAPSGFDAGSTEKIDTPPEPATEVFTVPGSPSAPTEPVATPGTAVAAPPRAATPQAIPPRGNVQRPPGRYRSWGWVLALILVIAALAAVAILGTVWLTHEASPRVSQEDLVRQTIQNFDLAVQKGDLPTLRTITCGTTRDAYVSYDDHAWADTHDRVAAAKQYPVVASIDQVVVNGDHAEANVTTFMAYAPQTRSTRSFDLQYRDDQWKICQGPVS